MNPARQRLMKMMADILGVNSDEISDDSSMETVENWDSLKHMELIGSIEEEFEIPLLSADEIVEMTTVVEIMRVLKTKGIDI
jgi:acyl carrier protein